MRNYSPLLENRNVQAFLALLRHTEGAGYHTLFGGEQFESLADHPRHKVTRNLGGKPITSSAAGAYQFLSSTWDECAKALHLDDFSERSQDVAALFLIDRRKALDFVIVGQWENAITGCNREWASLPGSPYGQPTHSMAKCLAFLAKQPGSSSAPLTTGQAVPGVPTVPPMSKQRPLLLRWPSSRHTRKRRIWSAGSKPLRLIKLSARQRAIEVSSVHSPGANGPRPPPIISTGASAAIGPSNSYPAPSASPAAVAISTPTDRSRCVAFSFIVQFPLCCRPTGK